MVIVGAKGHAREILQIFNDLDSTDNLYFFDNVTPNLPTKLFNEFTILTNFDEVKSVFEFDKQFVLGLGVPQHRKQLTKVFIELGGELCSVNSPFAKIGSFQVLLDRGLNIMTDAVIYNEVQIGIGCLINTASSIHHNVKIGDFCEISPGARILGNVSIGSCCSIGANAVILPKLTLGANVVVGAGAVVTKDVPNNTLAVGVPAIFKSL